MGGARSLRGRVPGSAHSPVNDIDGWDRQLHWPSLDGHKRGVREAGRYHVDPPDWNHIIGCPGLLLRMQRKVAEQMSLGGGQACRGLEGHLLLLFWSVRLRRSPQRNPRCCLRAALRRRRRKSYRCCALKGRTQNPFRAWLSRSRS